MYVKQRKKVVYIRQEDRNYLTILEKLLCYIRKIFMIIKIEYARDDVVIVVPQYRHQSLFLNRILIKKIRRKVANFEGYYISFDDKLKCISDIVRQYQNVEDKLLMRELVMEIFEYIFDTGKKCINLENVYIFVNEYNKMNADLIELMASKFKTVNIITEKLRYYRRLEEKLYDSGILITVSNNKRKGARYANYIVNIDYAKEKFEEYRINMEAVIVNLTQEQEFFKNGFRGKIINDMKIEVDKDSIDYIMEFYGNFDEKRYVENCIKKGQKIDDVFKQYNVKISGLIGVRGVLHKSEFLA